MNPEFVKCYTAGGAMGPNLIAKWGAADFAVILAVGVTVPLIGVTRGLITSATGDPVDIVMQGIYPIKAGGTITRGDPITSNGSGQAVTAAPSAGTNNYIIGYANISAVSGDLVDVIIEPQVLQG